jgi:hypothetical protein
MIDLEFTIESARPAPHTAAPVLALTMRVDARPSTANVFAVLLTCQVRLDAARRTYDATEKRALRDVFGDPERFVDTVRSLMWTTVPVSVPAFCGSTKVELQLPAGFDLETAAGKVFFGIHSGMIPLTFLFSGTAFHEGDTGALEAQPIPWSKEARFDLDVGILREALAVHYKDRACLVVDRSMLEQLLAFKIANGIPTWEGTFAKLLEPTRHTS